MHNTACVVEGRRLEIVETVLLSVLKKEVQCFCIVYGFLEAVVKCVYLPYRVQYSRTGTTAAEGNYT